MSQTTVSDEASSSANYKLSSARKDIGLLEIGVILLRRKGIVFLAFMIAILISLAYIFYSEPVYRADAYLMPPHQTGVQSLLKDGNGIRGHDSKRFTPERVFEKFIVNLKSRGLRREFFERNDLLHHYGVDTQNPDIIFDIAFNKSFTLRMEEKDLSLIVIGLRDSNPAWAAKILAEFIDYADKHTSRQLVTDVNESIKAEIDLVDRELSSKVGFAKTRRMDKVQEILQALDVAKELGIEDSSAMVLPRGGQANFAVNMAEMPLYLRGTRALKAEIAELKSRESDEAFIDGLRDLQERRSFLESLFIDVASVSAVSADPELRIPYQSETPGVAWIVTLAGLVGILAGILAVLMVEMFTRLKRQSDGGLG